MSELRDSLIIIFLLMLSPLIGICASVVSLLFFFVFPIWIAWRVFLERVMKRTPGLYRD